MLETLINAKLVVEMGISDCLVLELVIADLRMEMLMELAVGTRALAGRGVPRPRQILTSAGRPFVLRALRMRTLFSVLS